MAPKFFLCRRHFFLSLARKISEYATWNGMQGLKPRESRHSEDNLLCNRNKEEFGDKRAERENQGMRSGE